MSPDAFLGRALLDPTTGLPNVPYFKLIREWEERRAQRRGYSVREVTMQVRGGAVRVRRALSWRLCRELRESDLVASGGPGEYHILLTSPDAEYAGEVCARIEQVAREINLRHPDDPPLEISLAVEPPLESGPLPQRAVPEADSPARPAQPSRPDREVPLARADAPVMSDREVHRAPSMEPSAGPGERRRIASDRDETIVPPRSCGESGGTNAA